MEQHLPHVRRRVLIALLASTLLFLLLVLVILPPVVGFARRAAHHSRLNYLLSPLLVAAPMWLVYRYLAPVSRLRALLQRGEEIPAKAVHHARRVAFDAPALLLLTMVGVTLLWTLLANVGVLLLFPAYQLAPYFSESLLVLATGLTTGVFCALVTRWQLRPVLVVTARLVPMAGTPPTGKGLRFDVRTRLLIAIVGLNIIAYAVPSMLALNLVVSAAQVPDSVIQRMIYILLGAGLAILGLNLGLSFAMTADITGDLAQITRRLLEVARRGRTEEQLHALSLDEIGDLVQAFNEIETRVRSQQQSLQDAHRRLLALQVISSRISTIFDLDQLLDELASSLKASFDCLNAYILLAEGEGRELRLAASADPAPAESNGPALRIPLGEGADRVPGTQEPLLLPDVGEAGSWLVSDAAARSAMATPMYFGGRLVGLFQVVSDRPSGFEERDLKLLTYLANQAAAAIEAARLLQKSQANAAALARWARNLMLINRIASALSSSLDAREILNMTVQHLVELIAASYGSAFILEEDGLHAVLVAESPALGLTGLRLPMPYLPPAQRALERGTPYVVENAKDYPVLETIKKQSLAAEARTLLLVPLLAKRDLIGVVILASLEHPSIFTDEQKEVCQTVASQAAVAVANARLLQDIEQQRRALVLKGQELAEESSKLDAILNNVADGLVVTDPAGRIILSNPAFLQMAGLPGDRSLRGRVLADAFHLAGLQELATQTLESPSNVFTENLETADGRVLRTSTAALRLPPPIQGLGSREQIAGVVNVLRDITHEVEVDRAKTEFVSAASHEMRTPLASIMGFASLIRRDIERYIAPKLDGGGKPREMLDRILGNLDIIENESDRITRLINDLLDIAKMEAGRMEWRMGETDLAEIVEQAVAATTALIEEQGPPIHVHVPDEGLPLVWADRDRLIQVMTNLLANAIKFTREGLIDVRGWKMRIDGETLQREGPLPPAYDSVVSAHETMASVGFSDGEWAIVSVTDNGVGIRAEDMCYVFDKYRQVGDAHTGGTRGTGLGLSICREIVQHHGGCIWAESEYGTGSTFSFALPIGSGAGPEQERESHAAPQQPSNEEDR